MHNQGDIPEINAQVRLMTTIYKKASRIAVWLGPEGDKSNQVMSTLHDFRQAQIGTSIQWDSWVRDTIQPQDLMALSEAIGALLMRPWFRRAWVIEEYALACQHLSMKTIWTLLYFAVAN